jgi:xylulose-5-phosphate/fructose-6-phosphate phosphoketolase
MCFGQLNRINTVMAGKQPAPAWLSIDEAARHCEAGVGVWERASTDGGARPHVVLACCGDTHGLSDAEFDALFGTDVPVIFNFHGYPWLIHRLTYRRRCYSRLHVREYAEEGTTTTPFDMCVLNDIDRFRLVMDVIDYVPGLEAADVPNAPLRHPWPRLPACAVSGTRGAQSPLNW